MNKATFQRGLKERIANKEGQIESLNKNLSQIRESVNADKVSLAQSEYPYREGDIASLKGFMEPAYDVVFDGYVVRNGSVKAACRKIGRGGKPVSFSRTVYTDADYLTEKEKSE